MRHPYETLRGVFASGQVEADGAVLCQAVRLGQGGQWTSRTTMAGRLHCSLGLLAVIAVLADVRLARTRLVD